MFQIKLINHKDITQKELEAVVLVKSTQWNYSFEKQIDWIKTNIKDTDIHVFLSFEGKNIAYLNLIDIELQVNDILNKGYGIGNVCAIEKGKGYGFQLMKLTNEFIIDSKRIGLLFCKMSLVRFYESLEWELQTLENSSLDESIIKVLTYNIIEDENVSLVYDGVVF